MTRTEQLPPPATYKAWNIEWNQNGFVYVIEARDGKKLATVYGTIEQRAANAALMAAAPKMHQIIAGTAEMLADVEDVFETASALDDATTRALTYRAITNIRRVCERVIADINEACG